MGNENCTAATYIKCVRSFGPLQKSSTGHSAVSQVNSFALACVRRKHTKALADKRKWLVPELGCNGAAWRLRPLHCHVSQSSSCRGASLPRRIVEVLAYLNPNTSPSADDIQPVCRPPSPRDVLTVQFTHWLYKPHHEPRSPQSSLKSFRLDTTWVDVLHSI